MKYYQEIKLKNGKTAILRNGVGEDGQAVLDIFNLTHEETDFCFRIRMKSVYQLTGKRIFEEKDRKRK